MWRGAGEDRPVRGKGARSRGYLFKRNDCLEPDRPIRVNNPRGLCKGVFQVGQKMDFYFAF